MLARVANNLFWMGRYIERSEHIARYLNINYFSSLDAPNQMSQSRQFVLRSMIFMVDDPVSDPDKILAEEEVLFDIGLNPTKNYAIINCLKYARENANSARDLISFELYESINKLYHSISNYCPEKFVKNGLYDFSLLVTKSTAAIRGKIRGTLLHDEVYAIIMLGINIERAHQVIRTINAKYHDALIAKGSYGDLIKNSYEWTTLLKCADAYDMMRRFDKRTPTSISTLEFLILNNNCPRSVMNSLNQIDKYIKVLSENVILEKNSAAFLIGKIRAEFEFKTIDDFEEDLNDFFEKTLNKLMEIGLKMEIEYFNVN